MRERSAGYVAAAAAVVALVTLALAPERVAERVLVGLVAVALLAVVADGLRLRSILSHGGKVEQFFHPIDFWVAVLTYVGLAVFMLWMAVFW